MRTGSSALVLALLTATCACSGGARLTPQQEWVMTKFAECKTLTNAINVKLQQITPEGRWSATVSQTQSEYNHLLACMNDESVSARLYHRAAGAGNGYAMANLGYMYEMGRGGLAKDDAAAVQWYRRGADAGNGQAMASLGLMYERGRGGLAKDAVEAARWHRTGAGAGDRYAMYCLGRAYEFGLGVAKDRAEAAQWYRKSAALGHAPASERLKALGE